MIPTVTVSLSTRGALAAVSVLVALACTAAYSKQYSGPTTMEPSAAYDCVIRMVTGLGYSVTDSVRSDGLIRAKTPRPALMRMDGTPEIKELTVSIKKDTESDQATIRVTANVKDDARAILATCS